jgi:di/tricarboxylate transporter
LERVVGAAQLKLARDDHGKETDTSHDDTGVMEAVVTDQSILVDQTPAQLRLYERYQVNLLAVSRRGERITRQMRSVRLRPGDVLVLQGNLTTLPQALGELGCLPLASRDLQLGAGRQSFLPLLILLAARPSSAPTSCRCRSPSSAPRSRGADWAIRMRGNLRDHGMANPDLARRADPGE